MVAGIAYCLKEVQVFLDTELLFYLIKILMSKLKMASKQFGINEIAIAGGVAANSELRKQLKSTAQQLDWKVYIPDFQYCTDNAAMIAITAYYKYQANQFSNLDVNPSARAEW